MNQPFLSIKTPRLLLRRLQNSDWEMIAYLRTDPTVNQFVKRPAAGSKEEALRFIKNANDGIDQGKLYNWCITVQDHPKMIGTICLWNFSEDRKTAEVGYDLSPDFQGKGIMNEALQSVLEFGFDDLHLVKIEAFTQKNNQASIKLLERNGFKWAEGRMDPDNEENLIFVLSKNISAMGKGEK